MRGAVIVGAAWGLFAGCGDEASQGRGAPDTAQAETATDAVAEVGAETAADSDLAEADATTDAATETNETDETGDAGDTEVVDPIDPTWGTRAIPDDLSPCDDTRYWPYSVRSEAFPVRVHYRRTNEASIASQVVGYIDYAWPIEVDQLGFRGPTPDDGRCGEDAAMDIFLWRDAPSVATELLAENHDTPWDDGYPTIVLDTRGELAGDALDVTTVHEFNHACQASDDWWDVSSAYESTATYIEDQLYDDDNDYLGILADFQQHPEWPVDYDDGYETYFMYGGTLYLRFLHDRYFPSDPAFIGRIWQGMRSVPPDNEPDYDDAIEAELHARDASFVGSVLEFARWRYYVGPLDDGRHLEEAGSFPDEAMMPVQATLQEATGASTNVAVMLLGSAYIELRGAGDTANVTFANADTAPQWVVQALPGTTADSDGETLTLTNGKAVVPLVHGARILVVTAVPSPTQDADPDTRPFKLYRATVQAGP